MNTIKIILCDNGSETVIAENALTPQYGPRVSSVDLVKTKAALVSLDDRAIFRIGALCGTVERFVRSEHGHVLEPRITADALARRMFDAYGEHCEWKAWDGRPMPRWRIEDCPSGTPVEDCREVNDAVRSHWVAAAEEALKAV